MTSPQTHAGIGDNINVEGDLHLTFQQYPTTLAEVINGLTHNADQAEDSDFSAIPAFLEPVPQTLLKGKF